MSRVVIIAETVARAHGVAIELGLDNPIPVGRRTLNVALRGLVDLDAVLVDESAPTVGVQTIADTVLHALKPGAPVYRLVSLR